MPTVARLRSARTVLGGLLVAVAGTSVLLPAPAAAADESTVVVGELFQAWPDEQHDGVPGTPDEALEAEQPMSWVRAADGTTVRVDTAGLDGVPAGSTVQVSVGAEQTDDATADDSEAVRPVLGTQLKSTPRPVPVLRSPDGLTNQITVAMVAPKGASRDATQLADVVETVDGEVADYWDQESGGALAVGVTAAHDWLSTTAACSDPNALWAEVAHRVGFTPGPGKHLLLYVSSAPAQLAGCSYALGQVGSGPGAGGLLYVRENQASIVAHELGHNFGLGHSSGLQCVDAVETGACRTDSYRDYYDVMGAAWAQLGSLNAAQAAHLGFLPAAAQQAFAAGSAGGAVTLAPLSQPTGMRALRLTDAAGTDYWLEYRASSGQDTWLGTADNVYGLEQGVLLRRSGGLPDTSVLLDGTPGAALPEDLQVALPVGRPVPVAGGAFTVVVEGISPAGATVRVATAPVAGALPVPAPGGAAGDLMPAHGAVPDSTPAASEGIVVAAPLAAPVVPATTPQAAVDTTASGLPIGPPVAALAVAGVLGLAASVLRRVRSRRTRP